MKVIKLRRGQLEQMPSLHEAELVYATDTNELYIGTVHGNTTLNYDGGSFTDTTRGSFIPRHGKANEITTLTPGELIYIEDQKVLGIALNDNQYVVINGNFIEAIRDLQENKRNKSDTITAKDIEENQIRFQHLTSDLRTLITRSRVEGDPIEIILAPNSIAEKMLQENSVSEIKIQNNAVTNTKIKDGAIGPNKLQENCVASAKIQNNAIVTAKIQDGAVTSGKIQDNAITEEKINNNAITTTKVKDGCIANSKIADNAITTSKIQDGIINYNKFNEELKAYLNYDFGTF